MFALETISAASAPARAQLRALPPAQSRPGPVAGGFEPLVRIAERLLPGGVLVLYREGHEAELLTWPRGVMGRRVAMEAVARRACTVAATEPEVVAADLLEHPRLARLADVREAGPLACALYPLPGTAVFGVFREAGAWGEEELSVVRELAAAFAGECERERLLERSAEVESGAARLAEERAREAQSRAADRISAVAPLLGGVCHELNNPLTSIKSFAELLLLDSRSDDDREALEIVQREAHRAARIVSDLRMVARQSQEAGLQRDPVDLNEVVRSVARTRSRELQVEGVELREELAPDLPTIPAVRRHLEQVASHLISNALSAMEGRDEARVLTLSTCRTALGVALIVRDTGRGIAPEHLGRVFDPFWTSGRSGEGRGLGLSLVHSIITSHGGRILAESQLGRGSSITVDLPLAEDLLVEAEAADERPASRGLRVLVVDDEAPIRFSLARYMERRGHQVEQAEDGRAALRMLEQAAERYDIVIADMRMPGVDGERLLSTLRERGDGLDQRLIFMTGDAQSTGNARTLEDSGVPVMWKPFELAEVAQIIEAHARLLAV